MLAASEHEDASGRARELAAARCWRLGLSRSRFTTVAEVVHGLLAVQAQEHAFSRWSVGQRLADGERSSGGGGAGVAGASGGAPGGADVDVLDALASGDIVRTHILRPTWHYVSGADLRWLQALTGEIVVRGSAGWYRNHGVDAAFIAASRRLLERSLAGGRATTRQEIRLEFIEAGLDVSGQRLAAALLDAELKALICSGPVEGKHHTYALVEERLPPAAPLSPEEATAELVRRYLAGHGPATLKDLRWWSSLPLKRLRAAVDDLGDEIVSEQVEGVEYLWPAQDSPGRDCTDEGPRFQLLQVFDELFVGYRESRGLVDPDGEFGAVLPLGFSRMMHVVLERDRLVGRWRSDRRGEALEITVHSTQPLSKADRAQLEQAVALYGAFVGLEATLSLASTR